MIMVSRKKLLWVINKNLRKKSNFIKGKMLFFMIIQVINQKNLTIKIIIIIEIVIIIAKITSITVPLMTILIITKALRKSTINLKNLWEIKDLFNRGL